jgi:F0F1-type ATP synthase assembly protein I
MEDKFKIRWDSTLGYLSGIIFVALLGKYFLYPEFSWGQILKTLFGMSMGFFFLRRQKKI